MTKIKQQPALFAVFVLSAAMVVDLFLPWQEIAGVQRTGFSGWGIVAMVFAAFVVVESSLQARGIVKRIPLPPPMLILLPAVLALIATLLKFFVDSEGRQPAAWVGLALAVLLVIAAYANAHVLLRALAQLRQAQAQARAGEPAFAPPEPATAAPAPAEVMPAAATVPANTTAAGSGGASCDGDWKISMNSPLGAQTLTVTLISEGTELSGRADTPFGPHEFYGGKVDGDKIAWEIEIATPMPMTLEFAATIAGDRIDGRAIAGSFGEFPFEGARV